MSNFTVSKVLSHSLAGCHFYTGKVSKVKEEQCSIYNSDGPNWLGCQYKMKWEEESSPHAKVESKDKYMG